MKHVEVSLEWCWEMSYKGAVRWLLHRRALMRFGKDRSQFCYAFRHPDE